MTPTATPLDPSKLRRSLAWVVFVAAAVTLLAHARSFDFVCDDAFITLRYARNLATLGAPVYNPGEHVEGYTNFLWMLLLGGCMRLGVAPLTALHLLGAVSGVAALGATVALWRRVEPERPAGGLWVLVALALSAPLAAWTLGGLETPLFTALLTLSVALSADAAVNGSTRHSMAAGLVLAAASLTRPEGALAFVASVAVVAAARPPRRQIATMVLVYLAVMGPFLAWRMAYYGAPLPNTFYVKTSGHLLDLLMRGGRYAALASWEMGLWFCGLVIAGLVQPARGSRANETQTHVVRRRVALRLVRILVLGLIAFVVIVGGDFLDLYRFFVPVLPLALVAVAAGHHAVRDRLGGRIASSRLAAIVACSALVLHGGQQAWLGARARHMAEPHRAAIGIEPLGWTRHFTRRWAALGRWLAAHAVPGDSLVIGAAGAAPFYSGLPNLDAYGLCDAFVARHGDLVGSRPGHQRYAPVGYIYARRATFMLLRSSHFGDWRANGYVWVDVRVDSDTYGGPETVVEHMLVRRDRAEQLRGVPGVQWADDQAR